MDLDAVFAEMSAEAKATGEVVIYAISVPEDGDFEVFVKPNDAVVLGVVGQMSSQRKHRARERRKNLPPWNIDWRENEIRADAEDRLLRLLWQERYRGSPHARSR